MEAMRSDGSEKANAQSHVSAQSFADTARDVTTGAVKMAMQAATGEAMPEPELVMQALMEKRQRLAVQTLAQAGEQEHEHSKGMLVGLSIGIQCLQSILGKERDLGEKDKEKEGCMPPHALRMVRQQEHELRYLVAEIRSNT